MQNCHFDWVEYTSESLFCCCPDGNTHQRKLCLPRREKINTKETSDKEEEEKLIEVEEQIITRGGIINKMGRLDWMCCW
jgi:hypothetical protein